MSIQVWISMLEFSDGSKIPFDKDDIVVFVGPNNAGKSASLKETEKLLQANQNPGIVIKDLRVAKDGDTNKMLQHLEAISKTYHTGGGYLWYKGLNYDVNKTQSEMDWSKNNTLGDLSKVFVRSLSTEERLKASNPAQNIKLTTDAPSHPIHSLQKNDSLERKFSSYFKQAFGTDLIVHRNAGNEVPLYVGDAPSIGQGEDRISERYQKQLEQLDLLHQQGDGMRSFVGVLLNAFVSHNNILFIDEPEAFLHPPQARLLGKMLAKNLPSKRQLFLATHSEDFLKGLLEANIENLKIIRIQRQGSINKIRILRSADIKSIWNDSLLRHSNVLDGLFHTKVVITESDSDSRFYSAILSSMYDNESSPSPDVLFIHCGGKHRIPVVIKALKDLDVKMNVIVDFDILNDIHPIKEIFEELGGSWTDIEKGCKIVKDSIDAKRPELETKDLKEEIDKIFTTILDRIISNEKISEIQKTLKKASPWSHAKDVGKSFIASGDATIAFEQLQVKLKAKGLYIVEVGEVEGFAKSCSGHGPKWVNSVLQKDLKNDHELAAARTFILEIST
jgi:predicted ATPase